MNTRHRLLVSAVVASITFLVVAVVWDLAVHGSLRFFAPLVGFVSGVVVSYLYRRAVGVRLREGRKGEQA